MHVTVSLIHYLPEYTKLMAFAPSVPRRCIW